MHKSNYAPLCDSVPLNFWNHGGTENTVDGTQIGLIHDLCENHFSHTQIEIDEITQTPDGKELAVSFYPEAADTTKIFINVELSDSFDDNGDVNKFIVFSTVFFILGLGGIIAHLAYAFMHMSKYGDQDFFRSFFKEFNGRVAFFVFDILVLLAVHAMAIVVVIYAVGATENYSDPDKGMNMESVAESSEGRAGSPDVEISTGTCFKHIDSWWAWNVAIQNHENSLDDAPIGTIGLFSLAISTASFSFMSLVTHALLFYKNRKGSASASAVVADSVETVAVKSIYSGSTTTTKGLKF